MEIQYNTIQYDYLSIDKPVVNIKPFCHLRILKILLKERKTLCRIVMSVLLITAGMHLPRELEAGSAKFIIQNKPARNFALFTLKENKRKILFMEISKLPAGGLMIVNFTSYTCKPCKTEIPELEKIAAEFKGKVKLWIVYTDPARDKIKTSAESMGVSNTVLVDAYKSAANKYSVKKIPATFILDKEKNIKVRITGYIPENMKRIRKYIRSYQRAP